MSKTSYKSKKMQESCRCLIFLVGAQNSFCQGPILKGISSSYKPPTSSRYKEVSTPNTRITIKEDTLYFRTIINHYIFNMSATNHQP